MIAVTMRRVPEVEQGQAEKDSYEVGWDGGESDPMNPRSKSKAMKWSIVLICCVLPLCVRTSNMQEATSGRPVHEQDLYTVHLHLNINTYHGRIWMLSDRSDSRFVALCAWPWFWYVLPRAASLTFSLHRSRAAQVLPMILCAKPLTSQRSLWLRCPRVNLAWTWVTDNQTRTWSVAALGFHLLQIT